MQNPIRKGLLQSEQQDWTRKNPKDPNYKLHVDMPLLLIHLTHKMKNVRTV